MLTKYMSVGAAFGLLGALLWGSTAGCSSSDTATPNDAGAASSSSSSGDAAASSSSSSSSSSGDSGLPSGLKDPNTVPGVTVTYGTCPTFTKCDGSVVGSWNVTGGCLPDTTFDSYKQLCKGLTVSNVVIKASGTVVADAANIVHDQSMFVQAKLTIDKSNCVALQFAGGSNPSCSSLNNLLTVNATGGAHFDSASCADGQAANTCDCIAQATVADTESAPYTTDGTGTLTSTGAETRTFDYCGTPAGAPTSITYHETTQKNATFGMFLTLAKQ